MDMTERLTTLRDGLFDWLTTGIVNGHWLGGSQFRAR